jgi:hypothetical protein
MRHAQLLFRFLGNGASSCSRKLEVVRTGKPGWEYANFRITEPANPPDE